MESTVGVQISVVVAMAAMAVEVAVVVPSPRFAIVTGVAG